MSVRERLSDFFIIVRKLIYEEMRRIGYEHTWADLLGEIIAKDQRTARRYCEQDVSQIPAGVIKRIIQRLDEVDKKKELIGYIEHYFHIFT